MFVINSDILENTYKCSEKLGKYLIKHYDIPLLSILDDGKYVFSDTDLLQKVLLDLPFVVKLFYR